MRNEKQGAGRCRSSPSFPIYICQFEARIKYLFILISIGTLAFSSMISCTIHGENIPDAALSTVDIQLPDEFVSGYFNQISYESQDMTTNIELTHPDANREYSWSYDDGWLGSMDYVDMGNTSYEDNRWTVNIAIHKDEPIGEWTLRMGEIVSEINVVKPIEGSFSVSGDVRFLLEPYLDDYESETQSVNFRNTGNVKMKVHVNYDDENLYHEVSQDVFLPGESGQIMFRFIGDTGSISKYTPLVSIEPFSIGAVNLGAGGNVAVISQGAVGLNFGVTVGYSGYEQGAGDNYEIQYMEQMTVNGYTNNNLTFYIYPHEEITFDIVGSNVEILDISEDPDVPLVPGDEKEVAITVHFRSDHRNDGTISLEVGRDIYTTNIIIGQTASRPPGDTDLRFLDEEARTITMGIILIGGMVAYGVGRIWWGKRKKEKREKEIE